MKKAATTGLRVACLMLMAVAIVQCGDNDVRITTGGGVAPASGTFRGTTSSGESITIRVGSIEAISFQCDGQQIAKTFSPPEPVQSNGDFDVRFAGGGRNFEVTGRFSNNDTVAGEIEDEDNRCDDTFDAVRIAGPAPTATVTQPGATATPTPNVTPTDGATTATPTDVTAETPTVVATATPAGNPCPTKLTLEGQGSQADLDSGYTGIAFDQTVINKGAMTVGLDCGGRQSGSCGSCTVSGPLPSTTSVDNQRCTDDTSITCNDQTPCPVGKGQCAFFFGAPLPLSSGGVPACVINRINGSITGTANPDTGAGLSSVQLIASIFTNGVIDRPCPTCSGASFGATGTCTAGPRTGQACIVDGTSDLFGNTSYDCPPGKPTESNGNLDIPLNPTTFQSSLQPSNTCIAIGFNGKPCYCPQQPKANDCLDGICTVDPTTQEGTCEAGPSDSYCQIQTYRGCLTSADCPSAGDSCGSPALRKCSGPTEAQTGGIATIGPLTRQGTPNKNNPLLVSTFCIPVTASSAVNTAAGLPGPGALRLPSKACYSDTCSF